MRNHTYITTRLTTAGQLLLAVLLVAVAPVRPLFAATVLQLGIAPPSSANESNRAVLLTWNVDTSGVYKVQSRTGLGASTPWATEDVVTATGTTASWTVPEALQQTKYYQLVLPGVEIFSVEPAVLAPGVTVDLYVQGQGFASNDVLQINDVAQSSVVFSNSSSLVRPVFTPGAQGTYTVRLVRNGVALSSFDVTCADASITPELVLQEPPDLPPASPSMKFVNKGNVVGNVNVQNAGRLMIGNANGPGAISGASLGIGDDETDADCGGSASARSGGDCDDHDPMIHPWSGEVVQQVVDLAVPGRGLDFVWARTYKSRPSSGSTANWTFSYDLNVQPLGGDILIHDGTGRADKFSLQTNGTYTCPGFFREGTLTNGIFRLTFADTGYWEFNPLDGSATAGKIAHIVDANSNTISLIYDTSGRLSQIVDDLGRTNTVAYNTAGQLASVTDFSGRSVTYQYYQGGGTGGGTSGGSAGDLMSVISPPVTGTPNGNDFPNGKTTTYTYSTGYTNDHENHLLLSIIDANGQTVCSHVYQHNQTDLEFLRCISVQRWTNTPMMISYLPQAATPGNQFAAMRCVVNDPQGDVTELYCDARNRCVKMLEFTGRATPGVRVTDISNRPTGQLRQSDPAFYESDWSWNNDSLCTLEVSPGGQQLRCAYEADFDKTTSPRKRADLRVIRQTGPVAVDLDGDGFGDVTERVWLCSYDPRFGTIEDRYLLGLKQYDPAKEYLIGDTVIYNPAIYQALVTTPGLFDPMQWQMVDDSPSLITNMRNRLMELENKLVNLGLLARSGGKPKGWDGTIKGLVVPDGNGMAIKTKGTGADKNRTAGGPRLKGWDGTIKGLIVPTGNGVAINTKGTGADKNRTAGGGRKGWDGTIKGVGMTSRLLPTVNKRMCTGQPAIIENKKGLLISFRSGPPGTPTCSSPACGDSLTVRGQDGSNLLLGKSAPVAGHNPLNRPAYLNFTSQFTSGRCISVTDPRGNVSTATYDAQGKVVSWQRHRNVTGDAPTLEFTYNPHGQVTSVTNPADANGFQRVDTFTYYTNGPQAGYLQSAMCDASGLALTTSYEYDARGNPTRCIDASSNDWLYVYNALDECMQEQTPLLTNASSSWRITTQYSYDANDNLVTVDHDNRDQNGVVGTNATFRTQYSYDALNRLTGCCEDKNGHLIQRCTSFSYDGNDNLILCRSGEAVNGDDTNAVVSFQYDERCLLYRRVSAPGSTAQSTDQFDYTPNGKLGAANGGVEQSGNGTSITYDGFDRTSVVTDPMGNQTTFNYDANDNLKVMRQLGEMTDVPGTNGNIRLAEVHYQYDDLDRPVTEQAAHLSLPSLTPIGSGLSVTTCTYAPNDQCITVTDDLGHTATNGYDTAGRLTSVVSSGRKAMMQWIQDRCGRIIQITETNFPDLGGAPQVFSISNGLDSLGRCVSTTDNVGNTDTCAYDSRGIVVQVTDAAGNISSCAYDGLGRPTLAIADINRDGILDLSVDASRSWSWDDNDRLSTEMDANGNPTTYSYDSLDRCVQTSCADGTHCSLVWSPRSNLTQEQDANGTVIVHTYDLNDRCVSNHITPALSVASSTTFESFSYDGCSRLVAHQNDLVSGSLAYDSLGNCVSETVGGLSTTSAYDGVGNRLSLTYPGGRALTYSYDELNRCTSIQETGASLASFAYAGPSRVARVTYGNGTTIQLAYDGLSGKPNASGDFGFGEIAGVQHSAQGAPFSQVTLGWDPNGNKTARADVVFGSGLGRTDVTGLRYDGLDRLIEATVTNGNTVVRDTAYTLDRVGNRTQVTGAACSGAYTMATTVPPADSQMNQYTSTPCDSRSYDDNGNLVSLSSSAGGLSYSYDCRDQLVSVSSFGSTVASYVYDALGRRSSKTVFAKGKPTVTQFLFDGSCVIEERANGAVAATYIKDDNNPPVWKCQDACLEMRRNGQDYYFHGDDQGNTLALTDSTGTVVERYDYDDYGAVTFFTSDGVPTTATSSSVGNVYLFGGMRLDTETGLDCDDGGGYLDFTGGRWVKRACVPLTFQGSWSTYANNNPWSGGSSALGDGAGRITRVRMIYSRKLDASAMGRGRILHGTVSLLR